MNNNLYAIYGASGFGREVMPLLRLQLKEQNIPLSQFVFIDDNSQQDELNGHKILTYQEFLKQDAEQHFVSLAIANSSIRETLNSQCLSDGVQLLDIQAPNVCVLDDVQLAEGSILCPFVILTSNIKIGRHFHANIYSYVAHDCIIGDYVTFAPGVKCNGNIIIEDHAYIGTGAVIKQGKPGDPLIIGRGAVVGMGAVVTKNVPAGTTVVGNPAKPLVKNS